MTSEREGVKRWLFAHCEDLVDLEILTKFHELSREFPLNEAEIAALAKFPLAAVQDALGRLCSRGLLSPSALEPVRYRYAVADSELQDQIHRVVLTYRSDPLEIMSLMTANAIERVRTEAVRTFAECFRIKQAKPNG